MAGYTLGFDDGGVIPDDDQEAPTVQDNTTPNAESPEQQQPGQEQAQEGAQPGFNPGGSGALGQAVNGGVKKIVSYLMGQGAADPQAAKKFEQGVKQEYPGISDDDANLMAVHKATELGGPAAGWAMVQYNRTAYNAKQSFANAALNGVDGKAGNAQAAALAATEAGKHILDGSATTFTAEPGGSGFTATVKVPGSDRQIGFKLTPEQFNNWTNVGKDGLWDKVMENGTPAALQQVAGSPAAPAGSPQPPQAQGDGLTQRQPTNPALDDDDTGGSTNKVGKVGTASNPELNANRNQPTNFGKTPSTLNLSGSDQQSTYLAPKAHQYSDEVEAAGEARFPKGGPEKQEWMSQQADKSAARQTQLDVAKEKGKNDIEKARQTGAARVEATTVGSANRKDAQLGAAEINSNAKVKAAQQQALGLATKLAATAKNAQDAEKAKNFRALVTNPNKLVTSPEDIQAAAKQAGVTLPGMEPTPPSGAPAPAPAAQPSTGQSPAAQAQQSGPPARPANVPQGAKFYQGKWYTRGPDGSAVPVQ